MPNSSNKIVFARRPVGARIAIHDGPLGPKGPGARSGGRFDLKEIQRRAFERGQTVEREKGSRALAAICEQLTAQAATQAVAREADCRRAEEFATRLALAVAEKLTFKIIAEEEHDVAGLVRQLLSELGSASEGNSLRLRLAPGDQKLLLEASARGELALEDLEIIADPTLSNGSVILATDEVEYWSELNDRIERLRSVTLGEARHV